MELWRELIINGLQNENYKFDFINDKILMQIIETESYKMLKQIKDFIENEKLTDKDCFIKIEELLCMLEEKGVFCDRHDFG